MLGATVGEATGPHAAPGGGHLVVTRVRVHHEPPFGITKDPDGHASAARSGIAIDGQLRGGEVPDECALVEPLLTHGRLVGMNVGGLTQHGEGKVVSIPENYMRVAMSPNGPSKQQPWPSRNSRTSSSCAW
jgi:hypothetical protein